MSDQACCTERSSQVQEQVKKYRYEVDKLGNTVASLESRLVTALQTCPPLCTGDKSVNAVKPVLVPLAGDIEVINGDLESLVIRLGSIIDRIEL